MSDACRRILTKEQMIAGLKGGRTLVIDRKDAPELPELLDLERQGLVESTFVEFDEQSSALKFRWKQSSALPDRDSHEAPDASP